MDETGGGEGGGVRKRGKGGKGRHDRAKLIEMKSPAIGVDTTL